MNVWIRAALTCAALLAGLMGFYHLAGAGSLESLSGGTGGGGAASAKGTTGILVNGVSGAFQGSPFDLTLDTEISTNAVRARAGQPLTLFGGAGNLNVTVDAGSIFNATNGIIATLASTVASITTLNVDVIQNRNIVTTQFKNDSGWSWATGAGANSTSFQTGVGVFTINVNSISGGLVLAAGDWYGGGLGFITTMNVSNGQATGTWASPVGLFTTLNVSNAFATNSLNGLLGNITTLNTTDTRATNSVSAKVGFVTTMNVTEDYATLAIHAPTVNSTRTNATGPSGTVSATLVLGVTGNVSQMFSDTTTTTTCQAPPSGNVSLTLSGSAAMPTVRVSRNNYIVSDGLDVATLGAGSLPTGNTTLGAYIVDNTRGNSPFFGTRQGFGAPERFYKIDTTGPFTVASKTAFTQVGVGLSLKKNALALGGRIHFQGSGRVGVKGAEGIALCVAAGVGTGGSGSGTGGTAIVGTTALAVLDSRTTAAGGDVSGNYIAIDFDAVLLAAPSAATNVRGGGFAALQSNSADANGSLQVLQGLIRMVGGDIGDTVATPDLSGDTLLALEVKWTSTSATNSLKLSREEWSLCQPQ